MKKPNIKQIQPSHGVNEAIIFLNGYQSKYEHNSDIWVKYLRRAKWSGSVYKLWWDAGSEYGRKYSMSPLGAIPQINKLKICDGRGINEIAHSYPHWRIISKRAKLTGLRYFSSLLSSIPESRVSVIGYSLGCRVIHYGMQNRSNADCSSQ
jgi:hypothetical protein